VAAHRALLTATRIQQVFLAVIVVACALVACTSTSGQSGQTGATSRAPSARSAPARTASSTAVAATVAHLRVVFLGDSYTGGSGASNAAKRWSSLVAAAQGWTEINQGVGGTGYGTRRNRPPGQPYPARLAEVAEAQPAVVVVSGGLNDLRSPATTVARGVSQTYSVLRSLLPAVEIIAVAPFSNDVAPTTALRTIAAEVRRAATSVGAVFVDPGYVLEGHAELVHQRGQFRGHPNDAGYARMALAIDSALAALPTR
jgi:lysophospholipase L1-like esterase